MAQTKRHKVFISYHVDDQEYKDLFAQMIAMGMTLSRVSTIGRNRGMLMLSKIGFITHSSEETKHQILTTREINLRKTRVVIVQPVGRIRNVPIFSQQNQSGEKLSRA